MLTLVACSRVVSPSRRAVFAELSVVLKVCSQRYVSTLVMPTLHLQASESHERMCILR